jgi:hypothetical protein
MGIAHDGIPSAGYWHRLESHVDTVIGYKVADDFRGGIEYGTHRRYSLQRVGFAIISALIKMP